jgi:hypothetical protein
MRHGKIESIPTDACHFFSASSHPLSGSAFSRWLTVLAFTRLAQVQEPGGTGGEARGGGGLGQMTVTIDKC